MWQFQTTKEHFNVRNEEETIGEKSFCQTNKNMFDTEALQCAYSNRDGSIPSTKSNYQDCLKQKLSFKEDTRTEVCGFNEKQKNLFFCFTSRSRCFHGCLKGLKTFSFRLRTIFKFYIQDNYLHLIMPMSFLIGLQEAFMAKDFLNVSI